MTRGKPKNRTVFLRSVAIRIHNPAVKEWFKGTAEDDYETNNGINQHALLIEKNDAILEVNTKLLLFKQLKESSEKENESEIILTPDYYNGGKVKDQPLVRLTFYKQEISNKTKKLIKGDKYQISYRLADETIYEYNKDKANKLALAIQREMATPPFEWNKGIYTAHYKDIEKGYRLRILCRDEAEGIRVIKAVLAIQNHTYQSDCFEFIKSGRDFPENPGTEVVYGQTRAKKNRRPRIQVPFRYAQLFPYGTSEAVNLVDTTGGLENPLVEL
ncbi:MAG: hypothetical protein F6K10_05420 [Moorea sp. SIO2B7]|nr:hypothetical protein [Moorena sp. SIO2B7]